MKKQKAESKCKGPEVENFLFYLRNRKEAEVDRVLMGSIIRDEVRAIASSSGGQIF